MWLALFAPARSGKTELALRRFSARVMGERPGWHIIAAMANGGLAHDTGGEVRDIIDSPEYRSVYPQVRLKEDAKAAGRFIVENKGQRGTYFCGGMDGSFPGRGANVLDIDDPHRSAKEADSARKRELASRCYFGDLDNRVEHPGLRLLTNTRRHEDDLAGRILPPFAKWKMAGDDQFFCAGGGWHVLRMRAIENEGLPTEFATWTKAVGPNDPLEYMRAKKQMLMAAKQARVWNTEFQQKPVAEEGTYLQRNWFAKRWEKLPDDCYFYLTTDFAVTEEDGTNDPDRTDLAVVAHTPEDEWLIVDWWSGKTSSDVWVEKAIDLIEEWKPNAALGEKGVIKNAMWPLIKKRMAKRKVYCRWEWMASTTDKKARARSFQAHAAQGRVLGPADTEEHPWWPEVLSIFAGFGGGGRYDDPVDAMSNLFLAVDTKHPAIIRRNDSDDDDKDPYEFADKGRQGYAYKRQ
ncbi:MAG: phage terminase large subunit [Deltaproteobacteria bacterium]|nr:phage terminase large subunit [Deltaproteobacteria bacterium]